MYIYIIISRGWMDYCQSHLYNNCSHNTAVVVPLPPSLSPPLHSPPSLSPPLHSPPTPPPLTPLPPPLPSLSDGRDAQNVPPGVFCVQSLWHPAWGEGSLHPAINRQTAVVSHCACTVEPPNKGHLGTRASVLYSEVSFIRRLEMC